MKKINVEILRGENKIGENLIEVSDGKTKILLECGEALEPSQRSEDIAKKVLKKHYDAVIITHSHLDHSGMLKQNLDTKKIYTGETTHKILKYLGVICTENEEKIVDFKSEAPFFVGDIEIIPHLCDHSAYDSYMIEIKRCNETILYTGDFRANGRKSFDLLLARLPQNIDLLICESTNQDYNSKNEYFIERVSTKIMEKYKRVFFFSSRTNVDRIVSFYKASRKTGKDFIMSLPCAEVAELCKGCPNPTYTSSYAYFGGSVNNDKYTSVRKQYGQALIGREEIAKKQEFTMQIHASMKGYLEKLNDLSSLKGSVLIYSMWQGYKTEGIVREMLEALNKMGVEVIDLHISGHASKNAQELLIKNIKPKNTIFVHKKGEEK